MSYEHIYDTEEIPLFGVTPPTRLTSRGFLMMQGRMGAVTPFSMLAFSSDRGLEFEKYNFVPNERY